MPQLWTVCFSLFLFFSFSLFRFFAFSLFLFFSFSLFLFFSFLFSLFWSNLPPFSSPPRKLRHEKGTSKIFLMALLKKEQDKLQREQIFFPGVMGAKRLDDDMTVTGMWTIRKSERDRKDVLFMNQAINFCFFLLYIFWFYLFCL
jgi:hypothetical protein